VGSSREGDVTKTIRLVVVLAVTIATGTAWAEQTRPLSTRERIEELERRLEELSARVSTTLAPEVGTASEAARRAEERIASLEERIADLSEELRDLQTEGAALQERVEDQRVRVDELEGETEGLSEREQERADNPMVDYSLSTGLVLRPTGDDFQMIIRGFAFARYDAFFRDEPGDDWSYTSEFSVPEARLHFEARLLEGLVRVAVQPSFSMGSGQIKDGYLEVVPHESIRLRVGQMRVPFDREWELDLQTQPLATRSALASTFGHGRDLGVMAHGTAAGGLFSYGVGVFNGNGAGTRNDNYDILFAARIRYNFLGEHTGMWSDLERSTSPNLSLGLGFTYDLVDVEADDGSGRHYNRADYQLTADGLIQWYGAHLAAAVHYRASDPGAAGDIWHGYGYLVEAGYVAWAERLELVGRYTAFDPDVEGYDDHGREVAAGVNLFLLGFNARLTVLYTYSFRMPGRTPEELRRDGHGIAAQGEVWF
jgi:hypothetical protein